MTLASKWLDVKKETVKPSSYRNLHNYMMKACDAWGNQNIKTIRFGEIEDFLLLHGRTLSSKTIANMRSGVHDFFQWLVRREVIDKAQISQKFEYSSPTEKLLRRKANRPF